MICLVCFQYFNSAESMLLIIEEVWHRELVIVLLIQYDSL